MLSPAHKSKTVYAAAFIPLIAWGAAKLGIPDAVVIPLVPLIGAAPAALFRWLDRRRTSDAAALQAERIRSGCEDVDEVADLLAIEELPEHAAKLRQASRRIRGVPEPKPAAGEG